MPYSAVCCRAAGRVLCVSEDERGVRPAPAAQAVPGAARRQALLCALRRAVRSVRGEDTAATLVTVGRPRHPVRAPHLQPSHLHPSSPLPSTPPLSLFLSLPSLPSTQPLCLFFSPPLAPPQPLPLPSLHPASQLLPLPFPSTPPLSLFLCLPSSRLRAISSPPPVASG